MSENKYNRNSTPVEHQFQYLDDSGPIKGLEWVEFGFQYIEVQNIPTLDSSCLREKFAPPARHFLNIYL